MKVMKGFEVYVVYVSDKNNGKRVDYYNDKLIGRTYADKKMAEMYKNYLENSNVFNEHEVKIDVQFAASSNIAKFCWKSVPTEKL